MASMRPKNRFVVVALGLAAFAIGGAGTATWAGAFDDAVEPHPDLAIELRIDGPITWPEQLEVQEKNGVTWQRGVRIPKTAELVNQSSTETLLVVDDGLGSEHGAREPEVRTYVERQLSDGSWAAIEQGPDGKWDGLADWRLDVVELKPSERLALDRLTFPMLREAGRYRFAVEYKFRRQAALGRWWDLGKLGRMAGTDRFRVRSNWLEFDVPERP